MPVPDRSGDISRASFGRSFPWAPVIVGSLVIGLWELVVRVNEVPQYLLPAPSVVWSSFRLHFASLMMDTAITAAESLLGFLMATVFACGFAVVFAHSRASHDALMPYLIGLKAVPVVAMAPLLVIWFGNGFVGKSVMAAVVCFFPVVVNLTRGLRDVPPGQLELMQTLSASRRQIFVTVRIPNSLPYFFAALKIASTLSVVGAIVAEFSGANRGIGYVILIAALRIDTPMLFSAIVLASLLGLLLYYSLESLEHRVLSWRVDNE